MLTSWRTQLCDEAGDLIAPDGSGASDDVQLTVDVAPQDELIGITKSAGEGAGDEFERVAVFDLNLFRTSSIDQREPTKAAVNHWPGGMPATSNDVHRHVSTWSLAHNLAHELRPELTYALVP